MVFRSETKMILLLVLVLLVGCSQTVEMPDTTQVPEEEPDEGEAQNILEDEERAEGPDVTFVMEGGNYYFEMDGQRGPELKVEQGDLVRIEFSSTEGYHDWVLDEFDARTERITPEDGKTSVEFVADEAGAYEYYCSVGSHREQGMFGTFIVE